MKEVVALRDLKLFIVYNVWSINCSSFENLLACLYFVGKLTHIDEVKDSMETCR